MTRYANLYASGELGFPWDNREDAQSCGHPIVTQGPIVALIRITPKCSASTPSALG